MEQFVGTVEASAETSTVSDVYSRDANAPDTTPGTFHRLHQTDSGEVRLPRQRRQSSSMAPLEGNLQ
ncbi:hypothetical protein [Micromonospora kangleipakensis]|uniref:hypothetical protein n=1 Tax=Micromonospora kangleipakensis TaxID=1077942 RepID=UPI001F5E56F4|nr:hypothetical protein [Micromonospora kangleipakensis]